MNQPQGMCSSCSAHVLLYSPRVTTVLYVAQMIPGTLSAVRNSRFSVRCWYKERYSQRLFSDSACLLLRSSTTSNASTTITEYDDSLNEAGEKLCYLTVVCQCWNTTAALFTIGSSRLLHKIAESICRLLFFFPGDFLFCKSCCQSELLIKVAPLWLKLNNCHFE